MQTTQITLEVPTADLFRAWLNRNEKTAQPASRPILNDGEVLVGRINDEYIVLLPGDTEANWKDAGEWAASIGGVLPNRVEQALMFATLKQEFKPSWYWSSEQHASYSDCAWMQGFNGGGQDGYREDSAYRARAIRRLPISPFNHLKAV